MDGGHVTGKLAGLLQHLVGAPCESSPDKLPLVANTFRVGEIQAALDVLLSGQLTLGDRCRAFEAAMAAHHGVADAVFCNSGSSANLLMLTLLATGGEIGGECEPTLQPGDEVCVPAVTWSTSLFPVAQVGALPVLVDVSAATLNLTVAALGQAVGPRTRAVLVTHLLGNPAPIGEIAHFCQQHGLELLEDCCEALGATCDGRKVGTFGRMASLSFYFSHHLCTIEGGMVLCGQRTDGERLRALRDHGLVRHLSPELRATLAARYPEIDQRFLFVEVGYNLRPGELQAAIGLVQLRRQAAFLKRRREVATRWGLARAQRQDLFAPMDIQSGSSHFALPFVLRREAPPRQAIVTELERAGVETRPLVAGNLARQPATQRVPHRVAGELAGANVLHERGFYVGIHPLVSDAQLDYLQAVLQQLNRGC